MNVQNISAYSVYLSFWFCVSILLTEHFIHVQNALELIDRPLSSEWLNVLPSFCTTVHHTHAKPHTQEHHSSDSLPCHKIPSNAGIDPAACCNVTLQDRSVVKRATGLQSLKQSLRRLSVSASSPQRDYWHLRDRKLNWVNMSKVQTRKVEKHFNWGAVTLCILWKNPSVIHLKKSSVHFLSNCHVVDAESLMLFIWYLTK